MNTRAITAQALELNAYAKINLSLYVLSRRSDGYHDIRSFMQGVNLCDTLKIEANLPKNYSFRCFFVKTNIYLCANNKKIPQSADNLAVKGVVSVIEAVSDRESVAELMKSRGMECISIHIEKRLPVAAGIAGGSGNAAVAMLGVNSMLGNPFSLRELMKIGAGVGADVSFSLMMNAYMNKALLYGLPGLAEASSAAVVSGIGDVVEAAEPRPYHVILFHPGIAVSTREVYEAMDEEPDRISYMRKKTDDHIFYNDLELYTLANYEEVRALEELIRKNLHADEVLMSGSGPTVVAYYTDRTRFEADYADLGSANWIEPTWRYWKTESGGYN